MGKTSANEATSQKQKPGKTQQVKENATSSTPTSSTSRQDVDGELPGHNTMDHEDAIQKAVDEQLLRELNATIPVEFRDADDGKTTAAPAPTALEIAEKKAQEVLNAQSAPSIAPPKGASKPGTKMKTRSKARSSQRELAASDGLERDGERAEEG
ncbi:hypothetical protein CLAFUW4_12399 [Fulvia fulva]|uniref:Uncharacterized protein n=1 Tax=Passalora fulva TaxID=5499 RepID=A0A9Q8PEW0_PASFU|nr:uncharacterized protein CLAFUR5_11427 [Fulvia fulva]KAK4617557.1 hypothetical protein CLAFUR4_12404 [Fulvia fulva]KAK4618624.1 hypothetical protein CLAFUR0_12415 [Fulvia fulva]UJO21155.1 hypothetical protein CLAFUR5_11427 [Fulvia fulva]WPV18631.1 hypothetical protein CLAFUW4_12399 [Fulvia fulva]WPV33577.1 hypothetical protein CLAFUW7_12406 [Fulvia fulva]